MGFLSIKKFVEPQYLEEGKIICGLDEVGRGPWAGPLVAAALIFPKEVKIQGCADSKKLTAQQREKIYKKLQKVSWFGVGIVSVEEVDELGLIKATNLAFVRALEELELKRKTASEKSKDVDSNPLRPDFLLIDGRDKLTLPHPFKTIIKGDEKIKIIACASIIAKVTRDAMMRSLGLKYPQYGFEDHKGYGTKMHQRALAKHGVCEIHRKSFEPVRMIKR